MIKRLYIIIVLTVLLGFSSAFALETADFLAEANELYAGRADLSSCEESIKIYEEILAADPQNSEAAWRLSRAYFYLGNHTQGEKIPIFDKGQAAARQAIEINPNEVEAHFWLGVNMGRVGEEQGVLNSLFLVGPIKDEMEAAIKIDPDYAGAYYTLSVLYRKAPGWPLSIGDSDKALEYAKKAVELKSTHHLYYLGLAEAYLSKGKKEKATQVLEKILDMPIEKEYIPEDTEDIEKARKLLKNIAG